MNRFRCTIASGGGALTLTVTCESAFAGATITATDGTTTLTKTCPSSSPYEVVFNLPNGGTWTISSGNDSVTVYFGDSVDLHHIPTGSSATPINDIQTWLHCANIWDKSYTTISQVLSDTSLVTTLIASNNAVDYMARSTSWASSVAANSSAMTKIGANDYCANKLLADSTWLTAICNSTYFESVLNVKVPTMTSNTTPSGEASASSVFDSASYSAYKAFDGTLSYGWQSTSGSGQWLQYKFQSAMAIKMICVNIPTVATSSNWRTFKGVLKGSNDGSTFTDIKSIEVSGKGVTDSVYFIITENSQNTKYNYYRLNVTQNNLNQDGTRAAIYELQLYGRA